MLHVHILSEVPLIGDGVGRLLESEDIRPRTFHRLDSPGIGQADAVLVLVALREVADRQIVRQCLHRYPQSRVLVLGFWLSEQFIRGCRDVGVWGWLDERASRLDLLEAVRSIGSGSRSFSGNRIVPLRRSLPLGRDGDDPAIPLLSARELQVLKGIRDGRSLKEMAAAMDISIKTVSTYRRRILDKLGLKTNADLVLYAVNRQLRDP